MLLLTSTQWLQYCQGGLTEDTYLSFHPPPPSWSIYLHIYAIIYFMHACTHMCTHTHIRTHHHHHQSLQGTQRGRTLQLPRETPHHCLVPTSVRTGPPKPELTNSSQQPQARRVRLQHRQGDHWTWRSSCDTPSWTLTSVLNLSHAALLPLVLCCLIPRLVWE